MNLRRKTPRPCRANQHRPFLLWHARRPDKDVTYTYITTDYGVARGCDYVPRMPATNSFHFARRVAAFAGVASYMDRTVERETTNNQPMQDSGLPNLALKFRINNSKRPLNLDRILIHL